MKRSIPNPRGDQIAFNTAVKENLEQIMGQRLDPIKPIPANPSAAELAAKVNEIIARLQ